MRVDVGVTKKGSRLSGLPNKRYRSPVGQHVKVDTTRDLGMGTATFATLAAAPMRPAGDTDHDLIARVRVGDDAAFAALYERYHRRIAAYIYGMVKDYGRAEDIAQDVFMSALRRMRETD